MDRLSRWWARTSASVRAVVRGGQPSTGANGDRDGLQQRVCWLVTPAAERVFSGSSLPVSVSFVLVVNLFFWLLRTAEAKPLGLIFGSILLIVILDAIATVLGADKHLPSSRKPIHPSKLNEASIRVQQWLDGVRNRMVNLRTENRSQFCVSTCFLIGVLWVLCTIGGALLLHISITIALVLPMLPSILKTVYSLHQGGDSDDEMGGFLPEMSPRVMEELQKADQPPESPPQFPSIDFTLPPDLSGALRYAAGETDSSDEEVDALRRKNNIYPSLPSTDTTDSESEFLLREASKDIPVPQITKSAKAPSLPMPSSEAIAVTASWLSSIMGTKQPPSRNDDSDSEFELINSDDL